MAEITTAGIFRRDNLFLVARRLPGGSMGGRWEFPGGKAEAGESPRDALAREILEELGAEISVGAHLAATEFSNAGRRYALIAFEAVLKTPVRRLRAHEQIRWLRWEEIKNLDLSDSDRRIYEEVKKENFLPETQR
jgi:8-oxo-dGTP diphosphatase